MPPRELPKTSSVGQEDSRVGLCALCSHARRIVSAKGSTFWLCERALNEPERFPKYPALPVRRCAGYEPLTSPAP